MSKNLHVICSINVGYLAEGLWFAALKVEHSIIGYIIGYYRLTYTDSVHNGIAICFALESNKYSIGM
jgi:hypothetical protein